jgi:hypothetical protein
MTGYLQRLLDPALPASDPPALTPVVKSTSPIFEQNQLLGLSDLQGGERDAEVAPPVARTLSAPTPSAPNLLPPAAGLAFPTLEIAWHDALAAMPASSPDVELGRPAAGDPLAARLAAANATAPLPPGPPDPVLEPVRPDPEIFEPVPRRATVPDARPSSVPEAQTPRDPIGAPVETERTAPEATPLIAPEAASGPDTPQRPAAPLIVTRDGLRAVGSIERVPDAPPPPAVLEPRPRPYFDDDDADLHQAQPMPLPAPPRITIGRVTVELVPDPAPGARSARAPRTAAAASMIGLLGNRRARRRLFALSRL